MARARRVGEAETERRSEGFRAAVRRAGLKLTPQRIEIFREVAASLEHPDAETVFRSVRARLPCVSRDTVYRTLWQLNRLGLLATLGPRRDSVRFDANPERHHHFVCLDCGLTRDFVNSAFDALRIPRTVTQYGSGLAIQVEVRGCCRQCSAKKAGPAPAGTRRRPPGRERGT